MYAYKLGNQSSHIFVLRWRKFRLSLQTRIGNNKAKTNNLPPSPCFPFVPRLLLSVCGAFPSIQPPPMCVHSGPLERGLMRANDGNACRCFPFINRSTLGHAAFHQQQSAISAGSFFSPPSITSSPYLLPFTSFSVFLSLYLSSPYLAGLSLTSTSSSMNTNMCKCCPNYCSMTFQWAGRTSLDL